MPPPPRPTTDADPADTDGPATCPQERFATLAAAQTELLTRRTRAALAGSPTTIERRAYPCRRCHGAHITRTPDRATP